MVNILTQSLATPSPSPSPQSKASFETKTSAINITPSTKNQYDIKQIKEDTLWLSKEAKTDEVTSLRIAILEYQRRDIAQLLEEPSDTDPESYNGITSSVAENAASNGPLPKFHSNARRRSRLLRTYLEERLYTLRVVHLVLSAKSPTVSSALDAHDLDNTISEPQWKKDLSQQIKDSWGITNENQQQKSSWVENAVSALSSKLDAMYDGQPCSVDDASKTELDVLWCQIHLLEMVQISQILLECINFTSRILKSHSITTWFGFMRQTVFFESSELVCKYSWEGQRFELTA